MEVVFSFECRQLVDLYKKLKSRNVSDDDIVRDLIVEALILARGDVSKALGYVLSIRRYKQADNDIWASVDHFFQSWNTREVTDTPVDGPIADVFHKLYSLPKTNKYIRENWMPRDDPDKPPSPLTWRQYKWGTAGAWAATWFSNDLWPTSPQWKDFLKWLDKQP